ncbi:GNAT family N-acetyltransferase [Candidatus Acetothermia bacterium]|nr:GNAT family N-acetyltransferase [Candidatus Acetothermia bacterium]MBI3642695.1 GNAT family N-acetyltransferase [Candidatus Acetothermia bacterium]
MFNELDTDRIRLRRFSKSDLKEFVAYRADPEVAKYQSWSHFTSADGLAFIQEQANQDIDKPGTWFQIALELRSTRELIGDCAVHTLANDPRQVEIGFTQARAHQGQGYAEEAVRRLLDFLFRDLKKHRVIAIVDIENSSAIRLLDRLGFRREAHFVQNIWFKGRWGSEYQFALLHEEWPS